MIASASNFARNLAGTAATMLFAGLCIAGATAPAAAETRFGQNPEGVRVASVSYADLDLGTVAGRTALEGRIRIAARTVCAKTAYDAFAVGDERACVNQAVKAGRHATMAAAASRVGG
jgi:UrcA family protein